MSKEYEDPCCDGWPECACDDPEYDEIMHYQKILDEEMQRKMKEHESDEFLGTGPGDLWPDS